MTTKITVPTDFSEDFIDELDKINKSDFKNKISEVYGCLPRSIIGSLRPSKMLPQVSINGLKRHVEKVHTANLEFNYTLNSLWINELENTIFGRKKIIDHISELVNCGIDRFTIALPFLARIVRHHFPKIKISASIVANVSNLFMFKQWVEYGADRIVISRDLNRSFGILSSMVKLNSASLELLATSPCLAGCAESCYHGLVSSAQSSKSYSRNTISNYGRLYCHKYTHQHPSELIKMMWIRPEDLPVYNDLGINYIKIDGRDKTAMYNLERIRYYCLGEYDGNLLYLLLDDYPKTKSDYLIGKSNYHAYIDNKRLNGRISLMAKRNFNCSGQCAECQFKCDELSEEVLEIQAEWTRSLSERICFEQNKFFEVE